MGDLNSIRETRPEFLIADNAEPEQRRFLLDFQERLLIHPELYEEALRAYLSTTNPERQRREPSYQLVGTVLDYLKNDTEIKLQAILDWHEVLHGTIGAISKLNGFDPSTENVIHQDKQTTSISEKMRKARREGARNLDELTDQLRVNRFMHFLGRAALQEESSEEEEDPELLDGGGDAA